MPFPTTSLLDDFDRGTIGANYSVPTLASAWGITSNQLVGSAAANVDYYNVTTYGPDCEVWATLAVLPGAGGQVAVLLGLLDAANALTLDGYAVNYTHGAPGTIHIRRIDNGAFINLIAATLTLTAGVQLGIRRVGLPVTGSLLTAFVNGAPVAETTEGTYTAAGYLGMSSDNTTAALDDFGGGAVRAADIDISTFPKAWALGDRQ